MKIMYSVQEYTSPKNQHSPYLYSTWVIAGLETMRTVYSSISEKCYFRFDGSSKISLVFRLPLDGNQKESIQQCKRSEVFWVLING